MIAVDIMSHELNNLELTSEKYRIVKWDGMNATDRMISKKMTPVYPNYKEVDILHEIDNNTIIKNNDANNSNNNNDNISKYDTNSNSNSNDHNTNTVIMMIIHKWCVCLYLYIYMYIHM